MSALVAPADAGARPAAQEWPSSSADSGQALRQAARLSVELMAYSLFCLGAVIVFWLPDKYHWHNYFQLADVRKNETVFVPGIRSSFWELLLDCLPYDVVFFGFIPWALLSCIRQASWRQIIPVVGLTIAGYTAFFLSKLLTGSGSMIAMLASLVPGLFTIASFRLTMPRGSIVHVAGGLQLVAVLMAVALNIALKWTDPGDQASTLMMVALILPATKELWFILTRASARMLTLREGAGGSGVALDPSCTWPLFLWIQIGASLVQRVLFTRISSPTVLTAVVLYQSALEITLRLTLPARDRFFSTLLPICCRRGRKSSSSAYADSRVLVPALAAQGRSKTLTIDFSAATLSSDAEGAERATKAFISMVMCGELLAEYTAIVLACAITMLYSDAPLALPLDFYASQEMNIWTEGLDFSMLLGWTAAQLVAELCVDTLCTFVEGRRGYMLSSVWHGRPKRFWISFVWCTTFASFGTYSLVSLRDTLSACFGMDLCYCVSSGLQKNGLRSQYCMMLYPESAGHPPPQD